MLPDAAARSDGGQHIHGRPPRSQRVVRRGPHPTLLLRKSTSVLRSKLPAERWQTGWGQGGSVGVGGGFAAAASFFFGGDLSAAGDGAGRDRSTAAGGHYFVGRSGAVAERGLVKPSRGRLRSSRSMNFSTLFPASCHNRRRIARTSSTTGSPVESASAFGFIVRPPARASAAS